METPSRMRSNCPKTTLPNVCNHAKTPGTQQRPGFLGMKRRPQSNGAEKGAKFAKLQNVPKTIKTADATRMLAVRRPDRASTAADASVSRRTAVLICTVPRYCSNARWVLTPTLSIARARISTLAMRMQIRHSLTGVRRDTATWRATHRRRYPDSGRKREAKHKIDSPSCCGPHALWRSVSSLPRSRATR